jgi:broad specificity phosphatase PhoE
VRIVILSRHGESQLNVAGRVNADPARDPGLTPRGEEQARELGRQVAALDIELVVTSRFPRAQSTAWIALEGRDVPHLVDPELDDVRIGELEGQTIAEYRAWKSHSSSREQPFPGGESLDDAARRFARSFAALLDRPERAILVVCHEIPVRYAINAATGSETLDGPVHDVPNALPFVFDERGLADAVAGIERLVPGEGP